MSFWCDYCFTFLGLRTLLFFQNHMRVGPAKAKRADTSEPKTVCRPWQQTCGHRSVELLWLGIWIAFVKMNTRWNFAMIKRQRSLNQSGYTRRRFCMANI